MKFNISLFDGKNDNVPNPAERTWSQICSRAARPTIRTEKDGSLWSPATFSPLRRENESVTELSLAVLEFDHNTSMDDIVSCMRSVGIAFIVHSTHSHRRVTEKNPEAEARYRLIVPLSEPIPAINFPQLRAWLVKQTGNKADKAASALAQMYYTPTKANGTAKYEHHIEEGLFLDWSKLDLSEPAPTLKPQPVSSLASGNGHSAKNDWLQRARKARNWPEVERLWLGDPSGYPSPSEADLALCSHLAFYLNRDVQKIDAAFRASGLMRPKWDTRRGNSTWGQQTIDKAVLSCAEVYSGNGHKPIADPQKQKAPTGFHFTALDDLLAEPEEQKSYVWEKTLPCGGFSIVAAKPKVGKSTLARALAVAVSQGTSFFGRPTLQGKVIYLCLEEKRREVAGHFRRMGASGCNIIIHTGPTPKDALTALDAAIEEHSPSLVIIDPLSRFVRVVDFNSYGESTRELEPLIDLARLSDCQPHIMALHHNGKNGERESGDALLGSTGFFGAVDTLLTMHKRERARTVESIQRYGEDLAETIVHLDPETGAVDAAGDMKTFLLEERKSAIVDGMSADPLSEAAIKELVGGTNKGLTSRAVRSLFEEGRLSRAGSGKKGDPYLYQIVGRDGGSNAGFGVTDPQFSEYENPPKNLGNNSGFVGLPISADPENSIFKNGDIPDEIYIPAGVSDAEMREILNER